MDFRLWLCGHHRPRRRNLDAVRAQRGAGGGRGAERVAGTGHRVLRLDGQLYRPPLPFRGAPEWFTGQSLWLSLIVDIEGEKFNFDADTVVFAIGLKPNKNLLDKEGIVLTEWGTIAVDESNQTSIENVYAGGDVVDNKSVVCKALASGKKAAKSILEKIDKPIL